MVRTLAVTVLGLALAVSLAQAAPPTVGVGAFAGASIPIVQDDVKAGPQFGIRVPVGLLKLLTVEPYFASSSLGDGELELGGFTYTRDGFRHTQFGVNAMLGSPVGAGMSFYPYVGIGSNKLERDGGDDINEIGYNFGLGLGIAPLPALSVQLRGELNMVVTDDTSRKFGNATAGISYRLFAQP
jgi:hypothetical protein